MYKRNYNKFNTQMDFSDDLPCGGYEQEDKKIQQNLKHLSLQSEGVQVSKECCKEKCGEKCGSECCTNCPCLVKQQFNQKPKKKVECKKCKQRQAVLIHKNEQICKDCLLKNIEYKTRLTLENKIKINPKSKLLICFSGGLNSICLVKILSNIRKRYQKSPLFGHIECVHIQQQENLPPNYQAQFEANTQIKLNIISISEIFGKQSNKKLEDVANLFKCFKKNSNTIDLLTLFRNKLILDFAQENKFDYVLLAKNGESLAAEIFKYFTKGIGGSAAQLCSSQEGPFEYPLRQHLQKELQYYFYEQKLSKLSMKAQNDDLSNLAYDEIDGYLQQFIATLQDKYSHTAPAIVRTGEKIRSNFGQGKNCQWCWLRHDGTQSLCQKCTRLKEYVKGEQTWKLMPHWMLG